MDCTVDNRACIMDRIAQNAENITNKNWRDQTYRELAKTKAFDGDIDGAIALIEKIETPDTKAMTIRGIGMAAASNAYAKDVYKDLFVKLHEEAKKITHPPSFAIALTYIAMAQAFAGDHDGAWATAEGMENEALRHKAYGETAEIQAEQGAVKEAMKSIEFIDSVAYKNKSYTLVAKILTDKENFSAALESAKAITNPYKQAEALQYILDIQNKVSLEALPHD